MDVAIYLRLGTIMLRGQDEGGGTKKSVFVHAQGIKTVHAGGGGSENGKIMSTYLLNAPLQKKTAVLLEISTCVSKVHTVFKSDASADVSGVVA